MIVIAHRGASWDAPENTIQCFELACAQGADYVEFDVRAAPDGRLVIAHDPVRGAPGPAVPTLEETLAALAGRVGLAVELKEDRVVAETMAALRRHRIESDDLILVSFRRRALEQVQRLRPGVRCVLHLGRRPDPTAATRFWAAGFEDGFAPPTKIALARSLGLATTVFTVNDAARLRELAALGVTAVFTDRPGYAREAVTPPEAPGPGPSRAQSSR